MSEPDSATVTHRPAVWLRRAQVRLKDLVVMVAPYMLE